MRFPRNHLHKHFPFLLCLVNAFSRTMSHKTQSTLPIASKERREAKEFANHTPIRCIHFFFSCSRAHSHQYIKSKRMKINCRKCGESTNFRTYIVWWKYNFFSFHRARLSNVCVLCTLLLCVCNSYEHFINNRPSHDAESEHPRQFLCFGRNTCDGGTLLGETEDLDCILWDFVGECIIIYVCVLYITFMSHFPPPQWEQRKQIFSSPSEQLHRNLACSSFTICVMVASFWVRSRASIASCGTLRENLLLFLCAHSVHHFHV